MADKSGTSPQAVSLPVGGGDVRGLGESFQPDLNSGTGNYRVNLDIPPGVRNLQPQVALAYSTGMGNGPAGLGWALPRSAISRRTFRGVPSYDDSDTFLYNGTVELVEHAPDQFRPAVEQSFERVTRSGAGWAVNDKSGVKHSFGPSAQSRIEFQDGASTKVFAWLLERTEDPWGNAISYRYRKDGGQAYIEEIEYAVYLLRFSYEARPDPFSEFRAGFEVRTALRCSAVELVANPVGPEAVKTWRLEYEQEAHSGVSFLARVTLTGHDPATNTSASLPPLTLEYTAYEPERRRYGRFASPTGAPPPGLENGEADIVDLDGLGLPGVVSLVNGSGRYWPNRGGLRWGAPRALTRFPAALSLTEDRVRLADMDGNGAVDVLVGEGPFSAYYENSGRGWDDVVHYARSPGLAFDEMDVQLVDIDGDGLVDAVHAGRTGLQVYANRGPAGWDPPRLVRHTDVATTPPSPTASDPRVRLADLTGDGMLDVVHIASGRLEYWPSRGNGRYAAGRVMSGSPRFPYPFDPARVMLSDINGDGFSDVIYVGYDEITYWINRSGNGFAPPHTIRSTPPTSSMASVRSADLAGTGTAGLLWGGPQRDYRFLDFTGGVKPGLLTRIDNNLGQVIEVEYTTSTAEASIDLEQGDPWSSFLPFPARLVASVTVGDTARDQHITTRYRYHDGHFDGHRREFDGFARAEQIDEGDASQPTNVTVYSFHTEESARALEPDPTRRRSLKRKLHRIEVFGRDGSPGELLPYRVEESRWAVRVEAVLPDGREVVFPHVHETVTTTSEREPTGRVERRRFSYDDAGNITREERFGEGGSGPDLYTRTEVEYAENAARWIRDRVARIVVRDQAGNLLAETRHHYDGPDFVGLPLGEVARGHLSRTERVALHAADAAATYGPGGPDLAVLGYVLGQDADGEAAWLVQHERRRADAKGNVVGKRDPRGNDTNYTFDVYGLLATAVDEANGLTSTLDNDYRARRPRRLVDPNGAVTEVGYDPLGRLSFIASPGEAAGARSVSFDYDTAALPARRLSTQRITTASNDTLTVAEYLDGTGAVLQRRTQQQVATFVVSGAEVRNARGKTIRKLTPSHAPSIVFAAGAIGASAMLEIGYDALGRPVSTKMPTGGQSRVVHEAWRTLFYDIGDNDPDAAAFDTPRIEHYDAWQRLVAVEEATSPTPLVTSYALDALGRLAKVTDARGTMLTQLRYDLLGQRVSIQHADAGVRLFAYDAAGNLAWSRDAAGRVVTHEYDEMNRVVAVRHDGTVVEQLTYDVGSGSNVATRLSHAVDAAGIVDYSYDGRGNVTERTRTVPGEPAPFSTRFAYDRLGRVTQVTYPDGADVDYDYGAGFLLRAVTGYVDDIEYAPTGVRTALTYANGVRTEYEFDPATTQLAQIRTWHPASGRVDYHVRHDPAPSGNLLGVEDLRIGGSPPSRTQQFAYDAADRLVHAEGADPVGPYTLDYDYDEVGNFVRNPEVSPHPLTYAPGTNRLTGHDDGTDLGALFAYDANGNVTSMPGRTLAFNARGQLDSATLASGTELKYAYDHRGFLARKDTLTETGATSRTLYFEHGYELDGTVATRSVYAGDLLVAVERGGTRLYVHNDHMGSAVGFTNSSGAAAADATYRPFGRAASVPAQAADPAFAKRRLDADTGLYYFQARWYAPELGRFISPDPQYLLTPEDGVNDPRRLNPYAYAGNNPLRFTDRNGLGFWDVLGAIAIVVVVAAAVVITAGLAGAALAGIGIGTALAYAAAAGAAGALVGAVIGGIAYGSWEGALTGALMGFTIGANAVLGGIIFGPIVGGILGLIGFLGLFPPIANSDVYQGILGWSSYLMPMSWPGHAIGLVLWVINVVPYLVTFGQVDALRIRDMRVDWKTGNIFTVGGWVGQAPDRAFNFGAFTFVNTSRYVGGEIAPATFEHESGHMLNNAAFGIFQATRVFESNGLNSYWERLAESNVPPGLRGADPVAPEPDRPKIPLWGS